ncbi:hypothetical protein AB0E08_29865 [Streptomyces sp. NPDC048281]|uniref:hypothetical protein n=1 Tax=Streptomyces sp. NPDC048281 TaxID=3154715 RepID=UPI00342ED363
MAIELKAAAAEQQPAPERVVLVTTPEGVQLDRLQRQHQRLRVRTAEGRCLDLPPVIAHDSPLSPELILPLAALVSQRIDQLTSLYTARQARRNQQLAARAECLVLPTC